MRRGPETVILLFLILTISLGGCKHESETSGIEEISLEDSRDADGGEEEGRDVPEEEKSAGSVYVYVCGQVVSPGVYELPENARVYQAIEAAGGTLEGASPESLNLAMEAEDGQKIYVPSEEEAADVAFAGPDLGTENPAGTEGTSKVNVNTAGIEELMTLTGIGQTRAEAIIAYREKEGAFQSPEDIMNVDGIKEGIYEKLKDEITV